jgi:NDP-sugar pyrophosphorylase family protein
MRPYTDKLPKVLLPVAGRPFLTWQLDLLFSSGVGSVVLSVGHQADKVHDYLRQVGPFPGPVRVVEDGDTLLGTGGAVRRCIDLGLVEDKFLLTYGDSYLPISYGAVFDSFHASGKPGLMTVFRNEGQWDTSNVAYAAGNVVLYDKSRKNAPPEGFAYIDYGLSALSAEGVRAWIPSGEKADLAEMFHGMSLQGELAGFEAKERFYEIGSPQGLLDLEAYLATKAKASAVNRDAG